MIEKLCWMLGKKIGSVGAATSHARIPTNLAHDIKELTNDELVSHGYLRGLITRARDKEQLGRILHYLDHNNTNNLTPNQWSELRALIFERVKDIHLAKLFEHLDLIIMHLF